MIHKIPCHINQSIHETKHKKIFLPRNKMAANTKFQQSLNYLGGIIFHGLEYVIRHEVVFCFMSLYIAQLTVFLQYL